MKIDNIFESDLFTGVPDSQLKALCNYLFSEYSISRKHIVAANEGNAVGIAAGYYLATGKVPIVYLQNSGIGNIVNPVVSLLNQEVYGIPCIFIVGWRGQPGIKDEPQHVFQGKITEKLLENIGLDVFVISKETSSNEIKDKIREFKPSFTKGKSIAFIVCKDAFEYEGKVVFKNNNEMIREDVLQHIVDVTDNDIIVSTTGKTSRELFEVRERRNESHEKDFLTVGSMGHSSSIALGIALQKEETKVWCIDGDGAALMHMGAMAVIGANSPENLVHIVINNEAHESVGGMPTVSEKIDFGLIAKGCGYKNIQCVDNYIDLDKALLNAKKKNELCFIEVKTAIGSRKDLGRPTTTAHENRINFMNYLKEKN